jgi:hypothetical protein
MKEVMLSKIKISILLILFLSLPAFSKNNFHSINSDQHCISLPSMDKNSDLQIECYDQINPNTSKPKPQWQISFRFGFTRTHYFPTTMRLKAENIDITIDDYSFIERTSASYYNPKNWDRVGDAFRWIDEPTNTMILELSNGKDIFSFRAFHPKFLNYHKQEYWVKGTLNGVQINEKISLDAAGEDFYENPNRPALVRLQNTHRQMEYTLGYGRELSILKNKNSYFSITPTAHLGLMSGATKSSYRTDPLLDYWKTKDFVAKEQIQGLSYGLSSMIKWQYKGFSVFAEAKIQNSHLNQDFLSNQGYAKYSLPYLSGTAGFSVRLAKFKR